MSSEALLRIEYKLDLIIAALQAGGIMLPASHLPQMNGHGGPDDVCPTCNHDIKLTLDFANESINRTCGCKPPINVVAGISSLLSSGRSANASGRTEEDQAVPPNAPPQGGGKR